MICYNLVKRDKHQNLSCVLTQFQAGEVPPEMFLVRPGRVLELGAGRAGQGFENKKQVSGWLVEGKAAVGCEQLKEFILYFSGQF